MALLVSPLLILLLGLGLRLLPLRAERNEPWRSALDLSLALGLGLGTAALKAWYLAVYAMTDGTDTFDLPDVCITVDALRSWDLQAVVRQPVAALLPTLLSYPLGFFDGVAAGALASAAALGAALYLWGRTLHSRAAGIAAALFSCALNPQVVMTRQLTFFPESVAAFGLCAAGAAAALRWRNLPTLGLAGAGVGLALAAEHTGLIYGLAPLGVALVVALRAPPRRIPLRLAVLLAPILLTWIAARVVTPPGMRTLEDKSAIYTIDNVGHPLTNPFDGAHQHDDELLMRLRRRVYPRDLFRYNSFVERQGYNWGRSGPLGMARALATVALLGAEQPSAEVRSIEGKRWDTDKNRAHHVTPWIPVVLVALLLTLLALWRRPRELAGLVVLLCPFAVLLWHTAATQVFPKTLMAPMLPIPLLLGVGWATLSLRAEDGRLLPFVRRPLALWPWGETSDTGEAAAPGRLARLAAVVLPGGVAALLVLGLIPGWLSPSASWRLRAASDPDFYTVQARGQAHGRGLPPPKTGRAPKSKREACDKLFAEDARRGIPGRSRLYPRQRFEQRWNQLRAPGAAPGRLPPAPPPPPPPSRGVPGGPPGTRHQKRAPR